MSELTNHESTVNSLYLAFYGRPADPAGLAFWAAQLAANGGDRKAIATAFASSEEAQVRFGTDTPAERVAEIYQQLFNRGPDDGGLAFWTQAVTRGDATLADVTLAILDGAQGSDRDLSALRQQAMNAFTAQVEASGSQYDGYAAIEAARVLVRAVTAGASDADLDVLVKAAVSFADTATKTPQVVDAIATGTTLLALFDTARGTGDPVALAQALADTASAAAGDPQTLEQLLRGGGMAQVLKVMPAKATLKDVVAALAEGGLPAAVEVVYPSKPVPPVVTPPVSSIDITFKGVAQHHDDLHIDNVTNVDKASVEFTLGRAPSAGEKVQYSLDGIHWTDQGLSVTATSSGQLVKIDEVDLTQGTPLPPPPPPRLAEGSIAGAPGNTNLATTVYVQVVGAGDQPLASIEQVIEWDGVAERLEALFPDAQQDPDLNPNNNIVVNDPHHVLLNLEPGARVFYKAVEMSHGRAAPTPVESIADLLQQGWSTTKPAFTDTYNVYQVRQVDVSGNISEAAQVAFVLDTNVPAAPQLELAEDNGDSGNDGVTSNGKILISGLEKSMQTGWDYSLDNGGSWTFGGVNGYSGTAELDLSEESTGQQITLLVRQRDAAGNHSAQPAELTFTLEAEAPPAAPEATGFRGFVLTGSPSVVYLAVSGGDIEPVAGVGNAGMLDRSHIYLEKFVGGTYTATDEDYLDGPNFGVVGTNQLRFDATLKTALYQVNWLGDAFGTTQGALQAGVLLFAGGVNGDVSQEGFAVRNILDIVDNVDAGRGGNIGYAYRHSSSDTYTIFTGASHDLILDDGGTLDIGYRSFERDAQDLIIGFDAGHDKISLHDGAAAAIQVGSDGKIAWAAAAAAGDKVAVEAGTGAAEIVIGGTISTSKDSYDVGQTVQTLTDRLDLSQMAEKGELLILAKTADGKQGALFHFIDTDGDRQISGDELSVFAVFDGGAPVQDDIVLVGLPSD